MSRAYQLSAVAIALLVGVGAGFIVGTTTSPDESALTSSARSQGSREAETIVSGQVAKAVAAGRREGRKSAARRYPATTVTATTEKSVTRPLASRPATASERAALCAASEGSGFWCGQGPSAAPAEYQRSACSRATVTTDGKYAALTIYTCPGAPMNVQGSTAAFERLPGGGWSIHRGFEDATTGYDIPQPWCSVLELNCA